MRTIAKSRARIKTKVLLSNYGVQKMLQSIPLVPPKYYTVAETPLTIDVQAPRRENVFELRLEGDLSEAALEYLEKLPAADDRQ